MVNDSLPERAPPPRESADVKQQQEGLVVAIAPGLFEVVTADGASYLCTLRGRLRKSRPARQATPMGAARRYSPASRQHSSPTQPTPAATTDEPAPKRIAPGDRVRFTLLGNGGGVIEGVSPRHTALARARPEVGTEQVLLANPDQAVLVFAMREPSPHFGLL